jgi:predicted nucleic acid-binding protein
MAGKPVFVDTSVIVAASVAEHPSHATARDTIDRLVRDRTPLCFSPQVCREILVVLTRQPVAGRTFTLEEALAVLAGWRSATNLLIENVAVVDTLETLVERHAVRGKQVHDCNLVAVMLVHKVDRLLTRNPTDFKRFKEITVEPVRDW